MEINLFDCIILYTQRTDKLINTGLTSSYKVAQKFVIDIRIIDPDPRHDRQNIDPFPSNQWTKRDKLCVIGKLIDLGFQICIAFVILKCINSS